MDIIEKLFYVEIHPMYMTSNIMEEINKNVRKKYIDTCSEKNGYILDVLSCDNIIHSGINDCSNNLFFKVKCKVQTLLPKIGKKITCSIDMIFQHGIFAGFKNLKVLIPINTLKNWNHDHTKNIFQKGKKNLKVKDSIDIEITEIRYENCKYSCIGKLIEK